MAKRGRRFISQAETGGVWRVLDKKSKQQWGPDFKTRPDARVDELNGDKRPERLTELMRRIQTR